MGLYVPRGRISTACAISVSRNDSKCKYMFMYSLKKLNWCPYFCQIHWNKNVVILTKFSSLAALEVVILTTSSAASDEHFIKMKTFPFQCKLLSSSHTRLFQPYLVCCVEIIVLTACSWNSLYISSCPSNGQFSPMKNRQLSDLFTNIDAIVGDPFTYMV